MHILSSSNKVFHIFQYDRFMGSTFMLTSFFSPPFLLFFSLISLFWYTSIIPTSQKSKAHLSRKNKKTKQQKHAPNPLKKTPTKNQTSTSAMTPTYQPEHRSVPPTGSSTLPTVVQGAVVGVVRQQSSFGSLCLDAFASGPSERSSDNHRPGWWNYSFKWQIYVFLFFFFGKWGG